MNILFVSAILPFPLISGGQIRIYNILKELSKKHSISLFSFIRNEEEKKYIKELDFLHDVTVIERGKGMQLKYMLPAAFGKYPMLLSTYNNVKMKEAISGALKTRTYDCVHIEPFYVYPSIPNLLIPLVVSEHNVEYEVYETYAGKVKFPPLRYIQQYDAGKLCLWETKILKSANAVTTVSSEDAEKIKRSTGKSDITVVPNGVDTKHFSFEKKVFSKKSMSFVFIGNFLWLPNKDVLITLLKNVWPAIHSSFPHATLHIVGANVPKWAYQYKKSRVIIDGIIPDIREAYRNADALIAPHAIAGGTKFKILEAFACGCPVITTAEGILGITGATDECVRTATTSDEIVDAISDIYANPLQWQVRCAKARELVEQKYSWPVIATELSRVWKETKI